MSELDARLAALAARGEVVSYGALAADLGWRMAELTAALEATMEADTAAGRPLRAAICRAKVGEGLPARGFFDKAAALGHDLGDPAAFVAQQRAGLFKRDL